MVMRAIKSCISKVVNCIEDHTYKERKEVKMLGALTIPNGFVCVQCEHVFTGRVGNCPICGNGTIAPLGRWLS
jgi:rubrerythrin